jgi:hypothetical protein
LPCRSLADLSIVMAGLVPAIHVFRSKDVDARHNGPVLGPAKPDPSAGHDGEGSAAFPTT